MQNHYNLLYRRRSANAALCAEQGVGVLPWSPLARGRLTGMGHHTERTAPTTSATASTRRVPLHRRSGHPHRRDRGSRAPRWPSLAAAPGHGGRTIAARPSRSTSRTRWPPSMELSGKEIEELNTLRSARDQRHS